MSGTLTRPPCPARQPAQFMRERVLLQMESFGVADSRAPLLILVIFGRRGLPTHLWAAVLALVRALFARPASVRGIEHGARLVRIAPCHNQFRARLHRSR